jgi:hypothetical protein
MKKFVFLTLVLAMALMLGGNAFAQNVGDNSTYFVTYYSNESYSPDAVVRFINDGDRATAAPEGIENGTLWAAIYVFDDSQELQSCCACQVTSDGLLSEYVYKQLLSNEFTGRAETQRGVIKVISSSTNDPTNPVPTPGLRGWATHIQAGGAVTEAAFADSNLSKTELSNLGNLCSFGLTLGSGYGLCPCTPEDHDF